MTTVQPQNGLLGKNTARIYAFKPNENFVGNDEFEVQVVFNRDDGNGDQETVLKVNVSVY